MRMSRKITLGFLSAAMLTAACRRDPPPPAETVTYVPEPADPTWYDEKGQPIPEEWGPDDDGNVVPLAQPHDRHGRPWVWDSAGVLVPPAPLMVAMAAATAGTPGYRPAYSSGGSFLYGRPGYRSFGGPSSASPRPAAPSAVSRGGFGSTGARMSGAS